MEKQFKIWDNKNREFIENDNENAYFLNMNGKLYKMNFRLDTLEELTKDRYTVLNNISRKDKTGTPTYEGDIIKWTNGNETEYSIIKYDDYFKCYCIKMLNKFKKGISKVKRPIYFLEIGYEIIGNIFENPNLVEEYNLEIV